MYLLDTDIVSNSLKKKPSLDLETRLRAFSKDQIFVAAITIAEVAYGAHRTDRAALHFLRFDTLVRHRVSVLNFDEECGHVYGKVRASLERAGQPLAIPDLQIAATALRCRLVMVTGNVKHFSRVPGLIVENWL